MTSSTPSTDSDAVCASRPSDSGLTCTVGVNRIGRDFVAGDVHGCFRTLERALRELDFDASRDRLFGVGDLVNRGPHSDEALEWLQTRFTAVVMGNHERMLLRWLDPHRRPSSVHGSRWLRRVPSSQRQSWRTAIARMPLAVTIETAYGPVGLVHADVPDTDWTAATAKFEAGVPDAVSTALPGVDASEEEARRHRSRPVEGLRALVHGHFVVDEVERVANRWNIDTGATFPGWDRLTLLQVNDQVLRPSTFDVVEE